jgi:hypothetical protein
LSDKIAYRTKIAEIRYNHDKGVIDNLIEVVSDLAARGGSERGKFADFESDKERADAELNNAICETRTEFLEIYPDEADKD